MKKLKTVIIPTILVAGIWFTVWVVHSGALAINNFARTEDISSLPLFTHWLLFAARYGILNIVGAVLSLLAILAAARKTQIVQNALSLSLMFFLVFVSLGLAVFMINIGGCLCDSWRQWEKHDHPTKASTATNQSALHAD